MRRPRLYCPVLAPGLVQLPVEEAQHAHSSLRLKTGHDVRLFDGAGQEATGTITASSKKETTVEVQSVEHLPLVPFHQITLAVAMGRSHRQGYLIEKCTELGVAGILPIIAERSVSKPDAGAVDKWRRRAIEACKQCGRAWLPKIVAPISFQQSVDRGRKHDRQCIVHPSNEESETDAAIPFSSFLAKEPTPMSILVWIGPEGGWSDAELNLAFQSGAIAGILGPHILRTETAAITVCAAVALDHDLRIAAES